MDLFMDPLGYRTPYMHQKAVTLHQSKEKSGHVKKTFAA
jgi:hypothetical protein